MKKHSKFGILILLLLAAIVIGLAALFIAIGNKSNQAHQTSIEAARLSAQTKALVKERIALNGDRNKIIEESLKQQCNRMNAKFARIIPIEREAIAEAAATPAAKAHPKLFKKQVALVNELIKVLEPDNCNVQITGENPHPASPGHTTTK